MSLTLFGRVYYRRAYYLCEHCHAGHHYPLDQRLGIQPGERAGARAAIAAVSATIRPAWTTFRTIHAPLCMAINYPLIAIRFPSSSPRSRSARFPADLRS
jgi:hypothetical protein